MKETILTNVKAGEKLSKALDIALDVMRKTPHTRLLKFAFEMHYGREPNTEISNTLAQPLFVEKYNKILFQQNQIAHMYTHSTELAVPLISYRWNKRENQRE